MAERTFLFADLAGFTALSEAHGDLDAADIAGRFCDLAAGALPEGARIVKTIGDAVMVVADAPEPAIQTALDLVSAIEEEPRFPGVRCGLHSGTAVERDGDFFGAAVNLAARVAAEARSGQTLGTQPVASAAARLDIAAVHPIGHARLKNIAEPVELFEIEDRRRVSVAAEVDPVCRMKIDPASAPARLPFEDRTYFFCSFDCARTFSQNPGQYAGVMS